MKVLSIIVPTFNEQACIEATLIALQPLRASGHEVIVVDGGSGDETCQRAQPLVDQLIHAERGRARQMNAGAQIASGQVLLFLHADTVLPDYADMIVGMGLLMSKRQWGRFNVRLSGSHPLLRVVEAMMNWRSWLTGIATGDQAMFMLRDAYHTLAGFPDMPLMEDIEMSNRLQKRFGSPLCLSNRVVTSSRRWEEKGIVRTILLMWRLRFEYWLGVDPAILKQRYD